MPGYHTVVQRSVCRSGGVEHHLYGWGQRGLRSNQVGGSWLSELVSSAERQAGTVMRIMTSQCHIGSHSRHSHIAGVGRLDLGAQCTRWAQTIQRPGLQCSHCSVEFQHSAPGRKEAGSIHISNVRCDRYISPGEQLLQLSHMAFTSSGCLFIHSVSYIRPESGET